MLPAIRKEKGAQKSKRPKKDREPKRAKSPDVQNAPSLFEPKSNGFQRGKIQNVKNKSKWQSAPRDMKFKRE